MAGPNNISEIYTVDETTRKFSLNDKFIGFAENEGIDKKQIENLKNDISRRLSNLPKFIGEGLKNHIEKIIKAEVDSTIRAAGNILAQKSQAMKGIPIDGLAEKIETTPNPTTKVVDASIKGAVMGGFEKTLKERGNMINAAAGS